MAEDLILYKDSIGQDVTDEITMSGRPFSLVNSTIKFYMREKNSSDLVIDGVDADIVDPANGQIKYDWTGTDLSTPGEYAAWWRIQLPDSGGLIDTPEFLITVVDHRPGIRVETGAIYRRSKAIIPITWQALETAPEMGDAALQGRIEAIKLRLFNADVAVEDEAALDLRVQEYIAKLACLEVIPTGVDYWLNQYQSVAITSGTNEVTTYPNRIEALWKIYEKLLAQVKADQSYIDVIIGIPQTRPRSSVPGTSPGIDEGFVTPNPNLNFRDYAFDGDRTRRYRFGAGLWP
jgi:baseplate upper protein BppU